ncbi:MAG: acetylxylan esterase [Candidatus Latescibacter sp.]|nr:acetylxylan esterase [Candidatus Latescibacter sp.]
MKTLLSLLFRSIPIFCISAIFMFLFSANACAQTEDLTVLKGWRQYAGADQALYNEIVREAYSYLDSRDAALARIKTPEEWKGYITGIRQKLRDAFGPLPEKTPLNARTTGEFEHEGVKVEKVIFESRPGFQVTGCFFKPAQAKGRLPVVLYVCGHSVDGFRSEPYQAVILNLARKGIAVFAIDPVGQGERLQYFDPRKNTSVIGGPTNEHSYAGLPYLLLGRTMAMVRLWDGIRAIDYLVARPDVDPGKIGVHGRSGGGTMSAYIGAMDSRIAAAAPECYITSFRRLFQSIGPQDAEQNLLGQISSGLDHGDFILARAPKPTLIVTTTRDMFSIQGARETVQAARPAFKALGAEENLRMIEDDAPHQSTKLNRERVYAFFMKTFGVSGSPDDETIPSIHPELLKVTSTGQTASAGSKTVYDFIRDDSQSILKNLENSRKQAAVHSEKVRRAVQALSGFSQAKKLSETVFAGRFRHEGYSIEKLIIDAEAPLPIPALAFVPDGGGKHPGVLYVSQKGKESDTGTGGLVESLVRNGYLVLAVDLPGFGELSSSVKGDDSVIRGISYNLVFGAQLIGGSVTGIQAGAASRALRYLALRPDAAPGKLSALSRGLTGPALIHAAAFEKSLSALALVESPLSWESILHHRFYDQGIGSTIVPSALLSYDLPDLLGLLAPRPCMLVDALDGDGKPASTELSDRVTGMVKSFYGQNADVLTAENTDSQIQLTGFILRWLVRYNPAR